MSNPTVDSTLPRIPIVMHDVARLLGYRDAIISDRARTLIEESSSEAVTLVEPRHRFRRSSATMLRNSEYMQELDDAVLCVATIGGELERRVHEYDGAGEIGRALALNVCGSAAVEAVAEAAEKTIRDHLGQVSLRCSRRFSPGYGGWAVSEQGWLLSALDADNFGVTLTDGFMMIPTKSITFAVTVGANPREMRSQNPCDDCEMTCCVYRRPSRHIESEVTCNDSNFCPLDKWSG
jgi:hypothetical protein